VQNVERKNNCKTNHKIHGKQRSRSLKENKKPMNPFA